MKSRTLVAILAFALLLGCAAQVENSRHFVSGSGGVPIAYESYGSGDVALIFVHGWSCDRSYWREQLSVFSKGYRVIALDLGGHGDSSADRSDWSIESFARDIAAVSDADDVEQVILIGHSMGGPVVLEAAVQMGDRVIGVIGVDTLKDVTFGPMSRQAAENAFDTPSEAFPQRTEALVRRAFFIETSPAALVNEIAADMARGNPEVAAASGASLMTYNSRESLDALRDTPFSLINADYKPTNQAALESVHPNSAVTVIPNAGHFLMLEQPREFNAALHRQLDRIVEGK